VGGDGLTERLPKILLLEINFLIVLAIIEF